MHKREILERLRNGDPVSGEELGRAIGISRTAVWKHINELKSEGYVIDSVPGKGYCFVSAPDALLPEEIRAGLKTQVMGRDIAYQRETPSTQEIAKALAAQGVTEGTIVVAETQSKGRGRVGRQWSSPEGGVYFSIVLRPDMKPSEALRLPLVAGVAVAQAIKRNTKLDPRLKWPNDIMLHSKKVGGILTEMNAEMDRLDWVIVGIGLNVNTSRKSFPKGVEGLATSLMEAGMKSIPRVKLLQGILAEFESLYDELVKSGFESIRAKWKALSNTIGENVVVSMPKENVTGLAVDIDSDGALILEKEDGNLEKIIAGVVSLRKLQE
ncbi:MAG: biotin--[acetyl-CoA-carboxylase] ligase [Dehalococcoidia bacterium]|jgi:BirA family biotin operon repressor/biotin-[acetyl-CoA-carboxylase] ligase